MKQITAIIAMLAILSSMASALTCSIDAKSEVRAGEELYFAYTISSEAGSGVIYIPEISCQSNMPSSALEKSLGRADAKGKISGRYSMGTVNAVIKSQECTARIGITAPAEAACEKKIMIRADPEIDIRLTACSNNACTTKRSSFVKGSAVYLQAPSKVSASATASIAFPDKIIKTIALPGSFIATQSGEYMIEYTATKPGYKETKGTASIFVIEQAYTVPYADFSSKAGQAVVRPVFREPSALAAPAAAKATAKKSTFRGLLSRITGYFAMIF
ncbi:MAG TPA: hypothetical protein HA362_02165 [Nanoarchaeota archaeon]|nr:hypothetical protein [Nanoarchaeota archaeon]